MLDTTEQPVRLINAKAVVLLGRLVLRDRPVDQVNQVNLVLQVFQAILEGHHHNPVNPLLHHHVNHAHLDHQDLKDYQDHGETQGQMVHRVHQDQMAYRVRWDHKDRKDRQAHQDLLDKMVHQDKMHRMSLFSPVLRVNQVNRINLQLTILLKIIT